MVVAAPSFRVFFTKDGGDMGLFLGGNLSGINVFLHAKGPIGDMPRDVSKPSNVAGLGILKPDIWALVCRD